MTRLVLTLKLATTSLEHLHLRTFSFSGQFDTKSFFLCFYPSAQEEKEATCGCHQDMDILSGRVMFCLPHNIWKTCIGLSSLSEINVLLRWLLVFHTCSRSEFQLLNSDFAVKTLTVLISRRMLFLNEGIFYATSKMCAMLAPASLSCINECVSMRDY